MCDDRRRRSISLLLRIGVLCAGVVSILAFLILRFAIPTTDPALVTIRAEGKVTALAFSPDGQFLATLEEDASIRLRHVIDGQIALTLGGHTAPVQSIAMSPTGALLASGSRDGTVRLWEYPSGRLLATFPIPITAVPYLAFSPDGQVLAAAIGDRFAPDAHGYIQLWRVADQMPVRTLADQDPAIASFAFSSDGTMLITSNLRYSFMFWRIADGQLVARAQDSGPYDGLHFHVFASPSAPLIIADSSGYVVDMWRSDGRYFGELGQQPGQLWSLAISVDGQLVASASGSPGYPEGNPVPDRSIRVWRVADRTLIKTIDAHPAEIRALAFNRAGTLLASGGDDETIKLWNLK